jgi:hypothetical protein
MIRSYILTIVSMTLLLLCTGNPSTDAQAQQIDACGELYEGFGCVGFYSYEDDTHYVLDDYGSFSPGDLVHVTGTETYDAVFCGDHAFGIRVADSSIEPCLPSDLGCGVLSGPHYDGDCWLWRSRALGEFLIDQHDFASGDTVRVSGIICRCGGGFCLLGDGWIYQETLTMCPDSLSAVVPTTWGRLRMLFR